MAEPVAAVYFPRVGQHLTITPWSAQRTAMELLDRTRRSFRPQSAAEVGLCLLYTSDAADERSSVDLGGRRIIKTKTRKKKKKTKTSLQNTHKPPSLEVDN